VKFRAGELEFHANVAEASEMRSPQTGDVLRSLVIQFRAQKSEMHEQALEEAGRRQSGGLFSLDDADEPEIEWRVREFNSQYVGTEPWGINHHIWRIEQVERLACERLIVGPVTLEPYDYVERAADDGVVSLAARALIDDDQLRELSRISEPVDVVRIGISESPRRMRLTYVWGEGFDGQAIALMCEDIHEPRVTIASGSFRFDFDEVPELLALLKARGVLGDAELEELSSRRHAARRVANVDAWPLSDTPAR
jgi:hypothetical protein